MVSYPIQSHHLVADLHGTSKLDSREWDFIVDEDYPERDGESS